MARRLWIAAGVVCVGLGWLGLLVPMMPGTVFFLGAVYCFMRGNPERAERLLAHPVIGPPLRDWRERRAISRRAKASAILTLAVSGAVTWWAVGYPWALLGIGCIVCVSAWIATRNE